METDSLSDSVEVKAINSKRFLNASMDDVRLPATANLSLDQAALAPTILETSSGAKEYKDSYDKPKKSFIQKIFPNTSSIQSGQSPLSFSRLGFIVTCTIVVRVRGLQVRWMVW